MIAFTKTDDFPLMFLAGANTGVEMISSLVQLAEQEPFFQSTSVTTETRPGKHHVSFSPDIHIMLFFTGQSLQNCSVTR